MADLPESSSAPADDFIHVSLDKSTASLTDSFSNKSQYSQVVFHDLSEVYPTDGDISFTYSFQTGVIPQVGDRIALYKVGWSSVSEFITSVFATPPEDGLPVNDKIIKISFPVENLPKDEVNMYQFCYITSGNVVAGSSIPFTFRKPHGSELVAVEDPNDSGLVVFRSRVTQLQEQLEKTNAVKETLEKTINELKSELYLIKSEVADKAKKCDVHMEHIEYLTNMAYGLNSEKKMLLGKVQANSAMTSQIEELESSKESLLKDIDKLKENIELLQIEVETKNTTILDLNEKLNKSSQCSQQLEEVHKIKEALETDLIQLKNEIELLKNDLVNKNAVVADLTESKNVLELEIKSLKDDLIESGENFDQIAEAMKAQESMASAEMERLTKKLKEMTGQNNSNAAESLNLTRDLEKANNQVKSLEDLIKSKDRILKDILDASNSGDDSRGLLISLQDENSLLLVQVLSLEEKVALCEEQNVKLKEEIEDLKAEKVCRLFVDQY